MNVIAVICFVLGLLCGCVLHWLLRRQRQSWLLQKWNQPTYRRWKRVALTRFHAKRPFMQHRRRVGPRSLTHRQLQRAIERADTSYL